MAPVVGVVGAARSNGTGRKMEQRPTFSIISVTWRDLDGLKATAASVDAQVYRDFEWIVVDGDSDDGTSEWLSNQNRPNCRWTSQPDAGIFDAMNKGLDRSRGRYVIFMNSGDLFSSSETLGVVAAAIAKLCPPPDLVYGDAIDLQSDGRELYRRARRPGWIRYGMFASHQATYFRRDHCRELRHALEFPTSGDYAFIAAFLSGTTESGPARCLYVPQPLCRFLLGGTHFTGRLRAMREDYRIRRDVMHMPAYLACGLYVAHRAHHFLKLTVPALTRRMRYDSNEMGSSKGK